MTVVDYAYNEPGLQRTLLFNEQIFRSRFQVLRDSQASEISYNEHCAYNEQLFYDPLNVRFEDSLLYFAINKFLGPDFKYSRSHRLVKLVTTNIVDTKNNYFTIP